MIVRVKNLSKSYGRIKAVENVSFSIKPGEFVGLVGPNGAGKSTTIKMLAGQLFPTDGIVEIAGIDVKNHPNEARKNLGYVPEFPEMYDYLSGREMIEFVAEIRQADDIEWALSLTGLESDADRQIREYSQGMRRKTAIACALVAKPKLLILDESLNGLDPPSATRVLDALNGLREQGSAILLSTHILDTLEKVASRIIMMRDGKIALDAPAQIEKFKKLF